MLSTQRPAHPGPCDSVHLLASRRDVRNIPPPPSPPSSATTTSSSLSTPVPAAPPAHPRSRLPARQATLPSHTRLFARASSIATPPNPAQTLLQTQPETMHHKPISNTAPPLPRQCLPQSSSSSSSSRPAAMIPVPVRLFVAQVDLPVPRAHATYISIYAPSSTPKSRLGSSPSSPRPPSASDSLIQAPSRSLSTSHTNKTTSAPRTDLKKPQTFLSQRSSLTPMLTPEDSRAAPVTSPSSSAPTIPHVSQLTTVSPSDTATRNALTADRLGRRALSERTPHASQSPLSRPPTTGPPPRSIPDRLAPPPVRTIPPVASKPSRRHSAAAASDATTVPSLYAPDSSSDPPSLATTSNQRSGPFVVKRAQNDLRGHRPTAHSTRNPLGSFPSALPRSSSSSKVYPATGTATSSVSSWSTRPMHHGANNDWARVGRTEMYRGPRPVDTPLEYASPVTLSYMPGLSRNLHLCVYAVPNRPGLAHELIAFGDVPLEKIVNANGARIHVPIQVPAPIPDANGKVQENKVKPTAGIILAAEPPIIGSPPSRFTIGATSKFVERSLPFGRTGTVKRMFYTIHIALADTEAGPRDNNTTATATSFRELEQLSDSNEKQMAAHNSTGEQHADFRNIPTASRLSPPNLKGKRISKSPGTGMGRLSKARRSSSCEGDGDMDKWALVFRSRPVSRVNSKSSGGTMDLNYFSTKPLLSIPGATIQDPDEIPPPPSSLDVLSMKLGLKPDKSQLFSMPNAEFLSNSIGQRLKLSLYDERKYQLLGHTVFTLQELREMDLGVTKPVVGISKLDSRVVGTACLAQVEHGNDPRYFGFRISLPWL